MQALSGGRTNRIWRVDTGAGLLVVKLFRGADDNPLFRNDGRAEEMILRVLPASAFAPRLVHSALTASGFCLIYAHLDGHGWRSGVENVALLLSRLHKLDLRPNLPCIPSGSAALERQTRGILSRCHSADAKELLPGAEQLSLVPEITEPGLIHGDVVPNNLIVSSSGLRLIDWQCPALGDPCEDISTFLSPAMQYLYGGTPLTARGRARFLDAYGDKAITRRYKVLAPWFHRRMVAYCLWKSERGERDYTHAAGLERAALEELRRKEPGAR